MTQDLIRGLSPLHFFIIGCANNVDVIFQRLDLPNKRAVSSRYSQPSEKKHQATSVQMPANPINQLPQMVL